MGHPVECCKFDTLLLEAMDEALLVYGEKAKSAFYEYFEKALKISKREIPSRIEEFSRGLEGLLGLGARNLEILVMMKLHLKVGVVWEYALPKKWILPDLTFKEYVSVARKYVEEADNYEDQIGLMVKEEEARAMYR